MEGDAYLGASLSQQLRNVCLDRNTQGGGDMVLVQAGSISKYRIDRENGWQYLQSSLQDLWRYHNGFGL